MFLKFSTCLTIFSDLAKYISLQYVVLPQVLGFLSSTFIVPLHKSITFTGFKKKKKKRFFSYSEVLVL